MRGFELLCFCVSRHARIMPRPLQIRASTWLSIEPSAMALMVLPRALMTCPRLASRPILNCLVFMRSCSPRTVHFWGALFDTGVVLEMELPADAFSDAAVHSALVT